MIRRNQLQFWISILVTFFVLMMLIHVWWRPYLASYPPRSNFPLTNQVFPSFYDPGTIDHYLDYFGILGFGDKIRKSDLLCVGTSHVMLGCSASRLAEKLSVKEGKPIHVFNLGLGYGDIAFQARCLQNLGIQDKPVIVDAFAPGGDFISSLGLDVLRSDEAGAYTAVGQLWFNAFHDWALDPIFPRFTFQNGNFKVDRYLHLLITRRWDSGDTGEYWTPTDGNIYERGVSPPAIRDLPMGNGGGRFKDYVHHGVQFVDPLKSVCNSMKTVLALWPFEGYEPETAIKISEDTRWPLLLIPPNGLRYQDTDHLTAASRDIATDRLLEQANAQGIDLLHPEKLPPVLPAHPQEIHNNIVTTLQVFQVDTADAASLLLLPTDAERYSQVQALMAKGKGELDQLHSWISAPSAEGEISDSKTPNGTPSQTKAEHLGAQIHFEYGDVSDAVLNVSFHLLTKAQLGFDDHVMNSNAARPALFGEQKLDIDQLRLPLGQFSFLGSLGGYELNGSKGPGRVGLVFAKLDLLSSTVQSDDPPPSTLERQIRFYSTDPENAIRLLNQPVQSGSIFQSIQNLIKTHEAQLELVAAIRTTSGQSATLDAIEKQQIADFKDASTEIKTGHMIAFSGTKMSHGVEVLHLECRLISSPGQLPIKGDGAKYLTSPVIQESNLSTDYNSILGEDEYIGIFYVPQSTGALNSQEAKRIWFGFIQTASSSP